MKTGICFFFTLYCLFQIHAVEAQSVLGKWKTYDIFDKNREEAIVEILQDKDGLYIKIIEIIPEEHKNDLCTKCDDSRKDQPILGMVILKGAKLQDNVWQGAKILNAKNGNEYGCNFSLEAPDLLRVRGFVGYPIFGKTLYWTRINERDFR